MKTVASFLIDTTMFFEHCKSNHICNFDTYDSFKVSDTLSTIVEKYNIDIKPYVFLLHACPQAKMFWIFFNKYAERTFTSCEDAKDIVDVLCFIFFAQYYFL